MGPHNAKLVRNQQKKLKKKFREKRNQRISQGGTTLVAGGVVKKEMGKKNTDSARPLVTAIARASDGPTRLVLGRLGPPGSAGGI